MASTSLKDVSLGIRDIGARTDFAGGAVTDLSAEEDRFANIILSEGRITPTDAFIVAKGGAATMNVVVGSGAAKSDYYVVEGTGSGQGNYIVRLESATETFSLGAADPSNARKDEVYIVVLDNVYDSSGKALAVLAVRQGDPAASPSAPGPDPSWDAYALLATVDIPASASDILACTVTDERPISHPMDLVGHKGTGGTSQHPVATGSTAGFMSTSDKNKLDGIESGAEVNPTASEILTAIKTVDGSGSGLDADTLDGVGIGAIAGQIINFDTRSVGGDTTITTSVTNHHSFTWTKPAGWGTATLLVTGSARFTDGGSLVLITGHVEVGGSDGVGASAYIEAATISPTLTSFCEKSGVSGNQTIQFQTQRIGGSTNPVAVNTTYSVIAIRTS